MTTKNRVNHLEEAMANLINSQATVLNHIDTINTRSDERFVRIERDLDEIKKILMRHEQMLQHLPEAIREKIGFKTDHP